MRSGAVAFLAGILLVHQLAKLPSLGWAILLLPLLLLSLRRPAWLIPFFFVAGVVWTSFRGELILSESLSPELERQDVTVEGYVVDIPQPTDHGWRFMFDVSRAERNGQIVTVPGRILLSMREHDDDERGDNGRKYTPGSRWRLQVRLQRPHGFANPGGFDYEAHLFRQRIRARGYVRARSPPQRLAQDGYARFVYRINATRAQIGDRLRATLVPSDYSGVVVALANGDTSGIRPEQWQLLRRTGTLHLVAISGLHISLVSGLVFLLARFLWSLPGYTVLRMPAPVFAAGTAVVAGMFYAALAGFTIPTQRALLMLLVAMTALISRRELSPSWILAAALLVVLLHDPFAVMAPGFWLSFVAVAVIVFVIFGEGSVRSLWRKWGYIQWAIALGMLPAMLWLFQQTSLIAPVANMLAVPVFDLLVVPLTLLGTVVQWMMSETVGGWLLSLAAWLLGVLWKVLELLNDFSWAQWVQHRPPLWAVVSGGVGVMVLLAPRGWPARWIGMVWIAPLLLARPAVPAPGEMHFTLLDVGQGLAAVVRTASHTLVYDTGARYSSRFDAGAAVVVPYLHSTGARRIDALVISHGDNDHIGGLESVRTTLPVGQIISNVVPEALSPGQCRRGQRWQWDDVVFTVLGPAEGEESTNNNGSCVLHIESRYGSILLPGDIEKSAERRLLASASLLRASVLVAPHHGSRTSSTREFIAAVSPAHVLFPAGYLSRYGHPHPQVVDRYDEAGIRRHDSASAGAIEIQFGPMGAVVRTFRQAEPRFWRAF